MSRHDTILRHYHRDYHRHTVFILCVIHQTKLYPGRALPVSLLYRSRHLTFRQSATYQSSEDTFKQSFMQYISVPEYRLSKYFGTMRWILRVHIHSGLCHITEHGNLRSNILAQMKNYNIYLAIIACFAVLVDGRCVSMCDSSCKSPIDAEYDI